MNIDSNIYKIIKNERKISKKYIYTMSYLADKFGIPYDILYGIFLIETTFRPLGFRILEYMVVVVSIIMALFLNRPIRNYTIGKCQIGIGTILSYYNYNNAYQHSVKICNVNLEQAIIIIKSFFWRYNSHIFAWRVMNLYTSNDLYDYSALIRYIGYSYNGEISYGLVLERIIELRTSYKQMA